MKLIIDTTDKNCVVSLGDGDTIINSIKWQWKKDTGTEVLKNIDKLLKKSKKNLKDLKAILVNRGPGSFTGTRVGITVANTLGWSLDVPVIGYRDGELEKVLAKISKNKQTKFSSIAVPYYPPSQKTPDSRRRDEYQ